MIGQFSQLSGAPQPISILWLDDFVSSYKTYIAALKGDRIDVSHAATIEDALRETAKASFDLHLVDLKLAGGENGLDFIEKLLSIKPTANVCIFSSYLYQKEYRHIATRFPRPVAVLDKNIPTPSSGKFAEFANGLRQLAYGDAIESTLAKPSIDVENDDPFLVTYGDYLTLLPDQRDQLHMRAYDLLEDKLNQAFDSGDHWLLYLGDSTHPEARGAEEGDVWTDEQIVDAAQEHNRIPFQFRSPAQADDHHPCGGTSAVRTYPTVTFSSRRTQNAPDTAFHVHFDTGCFENFLSLEHWLAISGDPTLGQPKVRKYRGHKIIFYEKPLELMILDQERTGTRYAIDLNVSLVQQWIKSKFVMPCPLACSIDGRQEIPEGSNCRRRVGLIGRRLLGDNELHITIRSNYRTRVAKQ